MSKNEIKTIAIILVINIAIVIVAIIIGNITKEDDNKYNEISKLEDVNYFFSIENNLNIIPIYIEENNYNALYNLLNEKYIENNDIYIDNVISKFEEYIYTIFDVTNVYVTNKDNLYKYFIKCNIRKNAYEENADVITTEYIVLNYDEKIMSYNIEFISNKKYEEYISGKKEVSFEKIKTNNFNQFTYKNITDSTLATYYLNNFIDMIYEDSKLAYSRISPETKEKYFKTYDEFHSFIKNNNNMFNDIQISSYNISGKICYCIDNYNNEYRFNTEAVSEYIVSILFKNI